MKNLSKLISSVVVCELVGIASATFNIAAIPSWYVTLNKPSFAPPNWLFAPAWTLLYFLMGIAFYLIWQQGYKKKVRTANIFFAAQLVLNFMWSFFFFGLRSPTLGLIDIVLLWFLIVITMSKFRVLSKPAFYLLIPYILWVSFAALLNIAFVILN